MTGPQAAGGGSLHSIRCSFCGKRGTEVESIVAGPTPAIAICNQCIGLVTEIMAEQGTPPPDLPPPDLPPPDLPPPDLPPPPGDRAA